VRRWLWALAWLMAVLAGKCRAQVAQRYAPPAPYARWWREVEDCSGLAAPMGELVRLRSGLALSSPHSRTSATADTVWVVWDAVASERIVKHEMLHVLLLRTHGLRGHPEEFARCGL
jgi:hypothetical protein